MLSIIQKPKIYLDYNSTTPLHPELKDFVLEKLSVFGNASSVHSVGREAKKLVSRSRDIIARFLNVQSTEIIFTASGSESDNQAIKNVIPLNPKNGRNKIFVSAVEHPAVLRAAESLIERGYKVLIIPVSNQGEISLDFLSQNLDKQTALVSVMLVNNETGQIFPIKKIAELTHAVGAIMHSDMVQALGKIPLNLQDLGVDLASFSAHKFYSLKGVGILYNRRGTHVDSFISGGGQERGRRAGTENVLAISCFGEAVDRLGPRLNIENNRIKLLREALEKEIKSYFPNFKINGYGSPRVPHVINITCPQIDGETLLINLDIAGVAVSSGAACSSGSQEPSPVLRAMGLTPTEASESMRISLGWLTTEEEIQEFFKIFKTAVEKIRCVGVIQTFEGEKDALL